MHPRAPPARHAIALPLAHGTIQRETAPFLLHYHLYTVHSIPRVRHAHQPRSDADAVLRTAWCNCLTALDDHGANFDLTCCLTRDAPTIATGSDCSVADQSVFAYSIALLWILVPAYCRQEVFVHVPFMHHFQFDRRVGPTSIASSELALTLFPEICNPRCRTDRSVLIRSSLIILYQGLADQSLPATLVRGLSSCARLPSS